MLDEKAIFATINQVATLSLRAYGMTVKKFLEFLNCELPKTEDGGLCLTLINSKTGKEQVYSFSELVYDIRCMIHENENLNIAEETDYHILIDWSMKNSNTFGYVSTGKVICNGHLISNRLREILAKFITLIESMATISKTGSFRVTSSPEFGSIKPKGKL